MVKALEDLNLGELRHELKERQLSPKGKKEELRERLESWMVDNGFDVDDYEFLDPCLKQLRDEIGAHIKIIRDKIGDNIKRLEGKKNDTDMNKPKENVDFKMQDIRAEIDSLRQKQENVEGSTSGGFHDNLQIGVNIVDEIDNVELKECLTHVEGITPVSDVPVLCPIASFVSVEKRTEDIVDGSTLGGPKRCFHTVRNRWRNWARRAVLKRLTWG